MILAAIILLNGCKSDFNAKADAVELASEDQALNQFGWMAGSWISRTKTSEGIEQSSEEHWTHAAGGTMLGTNRTIVGGKTVSFENLRIEAKPDGTFYLASPNGRQPPTAFRLTASGPINAVFENPQHDYPQRISYWLTTDDVLHARVEGARGGKVTAEDFAWQRAVIVPVKSKP